MGKGTMTDFSTCKKINTLAFGGNNGLKIGVRKEFYKTMLHYRKLWILEAALKGE